MPTFIKSYTVTIPANTTVLTRIIEGMALSGKLVQLILDIPLNWQYAAGVQIRIGRTTYPTQDAQNADSTITGDDTPYTFRPNQDFNEAKLEIYGLNNDAINSHTCIIVLEVEQ